MERCRRQQDTEAPIMALASQTTRANSARRTSSNQGGLGRFRRRKARARRRNFFIVIVVVLVGLWWLVLRDPGSSPTPSVAASDAPEQVETTAVSDRAAQEEEARRQARLEAQRREAAKRVAAMPEPTRQPPASDTTGGARANQPISVITMGERNDPNASVGESISSAIDRAQDRQRGGHTPPPAESAPRQTNASTPAIASMIERAESAVAQNKLVEARTLYNAALFDPSADGRTQSMLRRRITELNDTLLFGPTITAGDPYTGRYEIESGDSLSKLPRKLGLSVNWRFLQRINGISDPTRIRVGQRIKTVEGPFHAVVSKSAYRLDLYMGESSGLMYVASFPVGLGENDSTPIGSWVVRQDSKLVNPRWVNPRTGEVFDADDPKNPIGERWIGIEGVDDTTRQLNGFGIHGTVEPDSIGTQASMGCVRLGDDDVALVYELLIEGVSRVEITP